MKPLPKTGVDRPEGEWTALLPSYERLIADGSRDSSYLRNVGLQRNVVELAGDCTSACVLDIGCGNGWFLDTVTAREGYECDCVPQTGARDGRHFSVQDICELTYETNSFDVVVASLVLMWVERLEQACRELYRVTSTGGRSVVALVHPFSYRTGNVTESGDFLVTRRYADPFTLPDLFIGERVGPFRYFHRPLSTYMNALCDVGFHLEQMREWSLDIDEYRRRFPSNSSHPPRTDRVPMYVFLLLRKAS